MNREQTHEMVGTLLDALQEASFQDKKVARIVMLGTAYGDLRQDVSANQFLKPAGQGYEFSGIPVVSAKADGDKPFRLEYE
jgi:hypothetical protein